MEKYEKIFEFESGSKLKVEFTIDKDRASKEEMQLISEVLGNLEKFSKKYNPE